MATVHREQDGRRERESRVVLITGCSSGIGLALAHEFRRRGWRCLATARRPESVDELRRAGFEALVLDVTDPSSIAAAVSDAIATAGRIDVLVNNAGTSMFGPLAELPLDDLRDVFESNVVGPLAVVQAVFPHMAARRSGCIVNVGSMVGAVPTPFAGGYCMSKAAVHTLSDVLRMEAEPFGIRVVTVQPGAVRSEVAAKSRTDLDRYRSETSHYRPVAADIERRAYASQEHPMEVEEFARRLADAITRRRPPRTVRLGGGATALAVLERVPRLRDFLLSRRFGLHKL